MQTTLVNRTMDKSFTGFKGGDPQCPCFMTPLSAEEQSNPSIYYGVNTSIDTYGAECAYHDTDKFNCTAFCDKSKPYVFCPDSWCRMAWCYVDPNNCTLQVQRSALFPNSDRFYSYATCGYPDLFKNTPDSYKKGRKLRIGLNSNTGGWSGAYHKEKKQFVGPLDDWSGPMIDFIRQVSEIGNHSLEIVEPQSFLVNKSLDFFGTSKSDLCIYATSLGFIDICVASYTITEKRATSANWLVMQTDQLFLVTMTVGWDDTLYDRLQKNTGTIFQAFESKVWILVICFVIPCFGILTVVHERGHKGSAFPTEEAVLETNNEMTEKLVQDRSIPLYSDVIRGVYISFLSIVQMEWGQSVVSLGGHLNLIGIAFFILTFLAVYTANLAAILTKRRKTTVVSSIQDAITARYRFCAHRNTVELVSNLYHMDLSTFVNDPNDGLPGFTTCPTCDPRHRAIDFMDRSKTNPNFPSYDPRYCDAAILDRETYDAVQANDKHCNKTLTGKPVAEPFLGLPVSDMLAAEISPLFAKLLSDGVLDQILLKYKPNSTCPGIVDRAGGETASLDVEQLTGIWFVTGGLSTMSLIVTFLHKYWGKRKKKHVMPVMGRDQFGQRINFLERGDSFIWECAALDEESGRMVVIEPFQILSSRSAHQDLMKNVKKSVKGVAQKAFELSKSGTTVETESRSEIRSQADPCNVAEVKTAVTSCTALHEGARNSQSFNLNRDFDDSKVTTSYPTYDSAKINNAFIIKSNSVVTSLKRTTPIKDKQLGIVPDTTGPRSRIAPDLQSKIQQTSKLSDAVASESQGSLNLLDLKQTLSSSTGVKPKRKKKISCNPDPHLPISIESSRRPSEVEALLSEVSIEKSDQKIKIKKAKKKVSKKHSKSKVDHAQNGDQKEVKGVDRGIYTETDVQPQEMEIVQKDATKEKDNCSKKTRKTLKLEANDTEKPTGPDPLKMRKSTKAPKSSKQSQEATKSSKHKKKRKKETESSLTPLPVLDHFASGTPQQTLHAVLEALLATKSETALKADTNFC